MLILYVIKKRSPGDINVYLVNIKKKKKREYSREKRTMKDSLHFKVDC